MRAVELDDRDSSCHSMLAQVCLYRRQFDLALEHMERSVALNPNNQWNVADMGMILVYVGRAEEALAWNQRARQIDPYFDQPWYWRQSGLTCMVLGRYEDALKLFARHQVRKYYICGVHGRMPRAPRRHGKRRRQRRRVPVAQAGFLGATLDGEGTVQARSRRGADRRVDAPRRPAGLTD